MISPLWKETIQEKYNVAVFPFAFHIAVQQPFKPLWSRLLLYELEPSQAGTNYTEQNVKQCRCDSNDIM
jgi:hypothetical protein